MCGIVGFVDLQSRTRNADDVVRSMASRIAHRGPDDHGVWCQGPVSMAHRRLSILDLSPAGHQPMRSACGRYVIIFNGEIYNFRELRDEVEATNYFASEVRVWRGYSDTEVILASIGFWGIHAALRRFVGMFAIAVWDERERALYLARDRMGEKPLYYGNIGGVFLFGSEINALKAHPIWRGEIDRGALCLLLRHNYIPAPLSIYKDIHKVVPGEFLKLSSCGLVSTGKYWSLPDAISASKAARYSGDDREATDALERVLLDAVAGQMVADVPLGAFLSGGIDSSTIVSLMQAQSDRPVKTFSIGFQEDGFDEAPHAKRVATHLGTDHTELYVSAREALDVIPALSEIYDEPFSDSSQIPTLLVSQLAKKHVTVSLSGDGGDELFGGYNRYLVAGDAWRQLSRLPLPLRTSLHKGLTSVDTKTWSFLFELVRPVLPRRHRYENFGDKVHKAAGILGLQGQDDVYKYLVSHWDNPASVVLGGIEPQTILTNPPEGLRFSNEIERMMALDAMSYLPDDILVKVDRAAMAVSLETRVPMLDHRVVEFAWSLPFDMKIRGRDTKWLLKQVLYRYVPQDIMDRPKMGFGVPIAEWLRGPLRGWAEELLDPVRLREDGFFDPISVSEKWKQHLSRSHDWQYLLWDILMFQSWLRKQ